MRCGYFDCFSGAAGDMILGALVHAGLSADALRDVIARLGLPGVEVRIENVTRGGLAAVHVNVDLGPPAQAHHRHLPDILAIIARAQLPQRVQERATAVFRRLAEAEARVHGIAVEKVHFHEVGAADAIVDIVGTCAGLEMLGVERIVCSAIPTGSGTVRCEHGVLPVPAPATAELLRGVPLAASDEPSELTTPTGAALLTSLAESYGRLPALRIGAIGYGAGTRTLQTRPNLLRFIIGDLEASGAEEHDTVVVLEAQVDDAPGQNLGYACERLLAAGALDAYLVPILMKKGRPGQLVTVLCQPGDVAALEAILFAETTTFGVRRLECARRKLARTQETVETGFGRIRIKVGRRGDAVVRAWPEYDDCVAAARQSGAALRAVQAAALEAWNQRYARHSDAG